MPADSAGRWNLSIFQMMKLVVFFAVAFASVAPMVHLWQAGAVQGGSAAGLGFVAIFGAVLVPLEWIGLSLVLVRRGPGRDTLILCLLLCSVLVALSAACWILFYQLLPALRRGTGPPDMVIAMSINSLVVLILAAGGLFLAGRIVRAFAAKGVR